MSGYWLKSGALVLLEKASALVFSAGTAMILFRAFSKETFAAWGLFLFITYFLEMGRSGLIQNGLIRYLSLNRDQPEAFLAVLRASFALNLGFSVISNLVLWLASPWVTETWQTPEVGQILPVYFFINLVLAVFYQLNFVQQAHFEFRGIFWSGFFFRGIPFLWAAYCFFAGETLFPEHLAWSMAAGAGMGAMASLYFYKKTVPKINAKPARLLYWVQKLLSYGKFVLGTNLSTMVYKNIDKLALGQVIGPSAFAVYDAAGKVTQMVEAPSFSIAALVFPKSAERDSDLVAQRNLYEKSVGATLAVIAPFLIFVWLFAEGIIRIFAGEAYIDSAGVLRITAFFGLFMPFAVQFGAILDATGRPHTNFYYTAATAVLNLCLCYLLVEWKGLYGAAFATLTGYALSFIWMQRYLYRRFGVKAWRAFGYIPETYRRLWKALFRK